MASVFGDLSQIEKLSDIEPPLSCKQKLKMYLNEPILSILPFARAVGAGGRAIAPFPYFGRNRSKTFAFKKAVIITRLAPLIFKPSYGPDLKYATLLNYILFLLLFDFSFHSHMFCQRVKTLKRKSTGHHNDLDLHKVFYKIQYNCTI